MYWPDLGKVQEIGDMNIVSQMCAIAVMFVIMYFIFRRKRLYYIHRRLLLRYGLQACCHFSLIFSHLLQLKKKRISSYCYQYYLQIISLDGYMGCHGGLLVYMRGYFQEKELERKWRKRLWIFGILTDILIMVVPIKIYDSDNIVYTYGPAVIITYAVTVILLALILMLTKNTVRL